MVVFSVASPPALTAIRRRQHPPYKDMILRAVEALKERSGSSRRAISKFIAANFSDLPPTHEALLSLHLRRLRTSGRLLMLKHSYKLAPSSSTADAAPRRPPGRPSRNSIAAVAPQSSSGGEKLMLQPPQKPSPTVMPSTSKRRPGRPPKIAHFSLPLSVTAAPKRKPGRPPKLSPLALPALGAPPAAAAFVPKRRPGRPPKAAELLLSMRLSGETWKPAQLPELGSVGAMKRKPGRPPKAPSPSINVARKKPKPGRPPKIVSLQTYVAEGKRKPGRPPRVAGTEEKRKPGRPMKAATLLANVADGKHKAALQLKGSTESGRKLKLPTLKEDPRLGCPPNESMPKIRAALVMKGKPGRPAKVLLDASLLEQQLFPSRKDVGPSKVILSALPLGKRRPGRPHKEFGSMTIASLTEKWKPGRPAKHAAVVSVPGRTETRKRGRPKKPLTNNFGGEEQISSLSPVVKKRGRPPKVKDTAQLTLERLDNDEHIGYLKARQKAATSSTRD